jgi:hypothetical protein
MNAEKRGANQFAIQLICVDLRLGSLSLDPLPGNLTARQNGESKPGAPGFVDCQSVAI